MNKYIERFLDEVDASGVELHSAIMLSEGKIISETYYAPFNRDKLHRMFSVTKSFVSLAIGCLAAEGRIGLDDYICDYFPEYPTEYAWTKKTTIRNMLMMRSPHDKTTYKEDPAADWVESFFKIKPTHMPGTVFAYDTSATHTLGALVEKLSGKSLLDYLRGKFLDKIGFSADAYCLTDPQGVSIGGSGMMARPIDIAKTAQLVMNGGEYRGEQLLNREYLREIVSYQSRTLTRGSFADEKQGYGMQFWRTRNNGCMMYGMGGQLALMLPEKDFILVTTADSLSCRDGVQHIFDAFWREIYPHTKELSGLCEQNAREIPHEGGFMKEFCGSYVFDENKMGLSQLTIDGDLFSFTNKQCSGSLKFSADGNVAGTFPGYGCECLTSGGWIAENHLIIKSRLTGEMIGSVTIELYFAENAVTISARATEGHYFKEWNGVTTGTVVKS